MKGGVANIYRPPPLELRPGALCANVRETVSWEVQCRTPAGQMPFWIPGPSRMFAILRVPEPCGLLRHHGCQVDEAGPTPDPLVFAQKGTQDNSGGPRYLRGLQRDERGLSGRSWAGFTPSEFPGRWEGADALCANVR